MADNRDELRGVLFKNDRVMGDKLPNYRGQITIRGVEYRLSGWINKSKKGVTYMSLAATPPDNGKPVEPQNGEDLDAAFQEKDEDIPF